MKARQLIDGASFGPDALKVACQAFDEAWGQIGTFFGNDPLMIEGARLTLANAILRVASNESRDVGALKLAGIQAMARQYGLQPTYAHKNFKLRNDRVVFANKKRLALVSSATECIDSEVGNSPPVDSFL